MGHTQIQRVQTPTPQGEPKMNDLKEHILRLNLEEARKHEQRRLEAINRIKQLRKELKEKNCARDVIPQ